MRSKPNGNASRVGAARLTERRKRAKKILSVLTELFPNARMILNYSNHWELYVAVVLSAQCTDKKVNEVTEKLFKKYRTLDDYLQANPETFEQDIKSTGYYKNKTRSILSAGKIVKEQFGGKIPQTMEEIQTLPGVGRKTANVILGNAYQVYEGIAVDTHVRRLAQKWGLTAHTDPNKIEQDLIQLVPREAWFQFTYRTIEYGREYCTGRPHPHEACPIQ
jgi:endonuclease III